LSNRLVVKPTAFIKSASPGIPTPNPRPAGGGKEEFGVLVGGKPPTNTPNPNFDKALVSRLRFSHPLPGFML